MVKEQGLVQRDKERVAEEQFKSGNQHALTNPDGEIVKIFFFKCEIWNPGGKR